METKIFQSEKCPECGNMLEVFTNCQEKNDNEFEVFFNDGDKVNCYLKCGFESTITVNENNEAGVKINK